MRLPLLGAMWSCLMRPVPVTLSGCAYFAIALAYAPTEIELVTSHGCSGGPDGQTGLDETAVYEIAAELDVS